MNLFRKPTRFVFFRHGEVDNPDGINYGRSDIPLSEKGVGNVNRVRNLLDKKNRPRVFYCSPTQRTKQTAQILAGIFGLDRFFPDPRLYDTNNPALEGTIFKSDYGERDTGYEWETVQSVARRAIDFMQFALNRHDGNVVGVVAHEDILRTILAWIEGIDLEGIENFRDLPPEFKLKPAEAFVVDIYHDGSHSEGQRISPDGTISRRGERR